MEGKTVLFILAVFGVSLSKLTLAAKWPKCKNQTDLLEYYASIFERNAQRSVVKREVRLISISTRLPQAHLYWIVVSSLFKLFTCYKSSSKFLSIISRGTIRENVRG